jgi:hypothetical protein
MARTPGGMDYCARGSPAPTLAQKDYRYEYKRQASSCSRDVERIKFDTVAILATLDVQVKSPEQIERRRAASRAAQSRAEGATCRPLRLCSSVRWR